MFWDKALAAVEAQAADQLPALVRRELTLPRADAQIGGLREYAFRHQVLHQVTYDTVLKRHKREWHARVAQWLAGLADQGGPRAGGVLGLAAEHFELAGEEANAAEFHARAAERAEQRFGHDRVLAHAGRALALMGEAQATTPADTELRWRLHSVREQTLNLQARRDEQAADIDALAHLADQLGDDRRRAEVATRRAHHAMRRADWAEQDAAARRSMAWAARAGDDGLRLGALRLLAVAQINQGDIEAGRALAMQGLDEARRRGLRSAEGNLLNALSAAVSVQDDLVGELELDRQILLIEHELGDHVREAITRANLGIGWMTLGDLAQSRQELDAALQLLRTNGDRTVEGSALANLSTVALWQGDETRALALARQALDISVAALARAEEVLAGLCLGNAELALGRTAAAREAYVRAQTWASVIDSPAQHDASAGLARVALAAGDNAAALAALQPVLDHIAAGGTLDGTESRLIELTYHQTLARGGDPRAAVWLTRAHIALMAHADAISQHSADPTLRHGFPHNIPHHRAIVTAWESRTAGGRVDGSKD